jgi:hypothetical protein
LLKNFYKKKKQKIFKTLVVFKTKLYNQSTISKAFFNENYIEN